MTSEKVDCNVPMVLTISPKDPRTDPAGLEDYCRNLAGDSQVELKGMVSGIVEGETRALLGGYLSQY